MEKQQASGNFAAYAKLMEWLHLPQKSVNGCLG